MKIEDVSFPYPVLGISDDITPALPEDDVVIKCNEATPGYFDFTVDLHFDNPDIEKYIKDGFAEYSVEVNCRSTLYRECFKSENGSLKFQIDKYRLHNKVTFESYVIVTKDIVGYKNAGLHPDYAGHTIKLHKGDLMVAFSQRYIEANVDTNNLKNPAAFMRFRKDEEADYISFDLENKIIVNVPVEEFKVYQNLSKEEKKRICAPIYLQALIYGLFNFKKYKDFDQEVWVQAIKSRLKDDDIVSKGYTMDTIAPDNEDEFEPNDVIMLAQAMFNDPFRKAFELASDNSDHSRINIE